MRWKRRSRKRGRLGVFRDMIEMGPCIAMRASRLEPEGQRASRHGLGLVKKALPEGINGYARVSSEVLYHPFTGHRRLKPMRDPQGLAGILKP